MKIPFYLFFRPFTAGLFLFCAANATAQSDYFPVRKDSQTVASYERFKQNLTKVYRRIENTTNKRDLAQLFVNKASILTLLGEHNADTLSAQTSYAYALDSTATCIYIRHFDKQGSMNFRDNYKRIDAPSWSKYCTICQPILDKIKDKKVTSVRDSALYLRLKQIYADDQMYRKDHSLFDKYQVERRKLDSINVVKVKDVIREYGYPSKTLVGDQNSTPFFVIQHADLVTREMFLPQIKKAVKENELSKSFLMLIVDRIYWDKYDTQIFGTQSTLTEGGDYKAIPIDTSEAALKLKKEIDDM